MKILNFPLLRQCYMWDCGANAIEAVLVYYGFDIREGGIIKIAKTNSKGTFFTGLVRVAKNFGLKYKLGQMSIDSLKQNIDKGYPTIIALQAWRGKSACRKCAAKQSEDWSNIWQHGHYATAIGYSQKRIYFGDPYSATHSYLSHKELKNRWHDMDIKGRKLTNYGLVIYGKRPKYKINQAIHMD